MRLFEFPEISECRSRQNNRLPIEYHQLEPLFKSIFRWDPDERSSIITLCKHPFFAEVRPFHEFPCLRLPENARLIDADIHDYGMRGNRRRHVHLRHYELKFNPHRTNKSA
jgi:hypothetical protein